MDDLQSGRIFEGFVILIILAVILVNLVALKYAKKLKIFYRITTMVTLFLLSYELAIGGGEGEAFLWFYILPPATFYICGRVEGIFWVGLSLLISWFFFYTPVFYEYRSTTGLRFIVTYSTISVLSFGLEFFRSWYYEALVREKQRLEKALDEVKTLQGLLPICSYCKRIRDDEGYWNQIEIYIDKHSDVVFSHSICPACAKKHFPPFGK